MFRTKELEESYYNELKSQTTQLANMWIKKDFSLDVLQDDMVYNPLILHINECIKDEIKRGKLILPELNKDGNNATIIFSDYSNDKNLKNNKYYTYSFLVCGWNHSFPIKEHMEKIRKDNNVGTREIEFKGTDKLTKKIWSEYFNILDDFACGLLFTVVIDKDVGRFFEGGMSLDDLKENNSITGLTDFLKKHNYGEWKPRVAEELLRIVSIASYLAYLLTDDGQGLIWMTDNDAIASNEDQHKNLMKLFDGLLRTYGNKKFHLGRALPFKERDIYTMDLLSSTDIAASVLRDYLTKYKLNDNKNPVMMKEGSDSALDWLFRDGIALKKKTIIIENDEKGNIQAGVLNIYNEEKDILSNKENTIPVYVNEYTYK